MVAISPQEFRFDKAHNMFLEVGVGMGIFGLLSYIFVYYSAHYSLKTMNENTIEFFPKLILVFLVLSYAIQNLFIFDVFDGLIPFLIFLAFISTLSGVNKENSKPNQFKNIICILLIPFLLFSVYYFNVREIGFLNGYRHTTSYLREFTVLQDIQVLSRFKRPFTPLQEKILKEDREYILSLIQNHPTRWRPYVFICYIIGLQYEYKNIPKTEIDLVKQTYLQAKQYKVTLPDYERQYNLVLKGSADIQDQKEAALNIFFLIQKYPSLD
jgi:flagellar biosynthesis protein FliQ